MKKKKGSVNSGTINHKKKAPVAAGPEGWFYMSDVDMTAAAFREALTDTAYAVEYWEAAQVLEIALWEGRSMDVEVVEPLLGWPEGDAFLKEHQVKFLCYVTFPSEDYETATAVMEHICGRIGGFFCGDTEDFTPVVGKRDERAREL